MQILLLFIKTPRLGHVKTRLAATVGNDAALEIYKILLEKTRMAALETTAERWLWYSEAIDEQDDWSAAHFQKRVQPTGDLGERMKGAFEAAFSTGAQRVVIIGSDCPEVSGAIVDQAFGLLSDNDIVIGPTFDGGYYLLGMRQFSPELFEHIQWSTESVFADTVAIGEKMGKKMGFLPQLSDIDHESDWLAYLDRQANKD